MTNQNPATPAPAATPGSTPNVVTTPPATTVPVPSEGKVTISTKEFAQLQRDAARGKSAQRRNALGFNKQPAAPADGSDPNAAAIADAERRAAEAERKAMQMEVKGKVSELLEKDEFKNLPKSTKALILANPAALSQADNLEEALLDVEDYIRDNLLALEGGAPVAIPGMGGGAPNPAGHETPPKVGAGGPAPVKGDDLEDLSKLRGPARSQAAIRNALKSKKAAPKQ